MSRGSLWARVLRGTRWTWFSDRYRSTLPDDFVSTVMDLEAEDRFHAKQGRTTARVRFPTASGPISAYLKRHDRLPWNSRLAATIDPAGHHSPGSAEWARLEQARLLGIPVPDTIAAGEWIGPWGALRSFLLVAELDGCQALNEALPGLANGLDAVGFAALKRPLIAEMAQLTAALHRSHLFHKDLYLCHFFIDLSEVARPGRRLSMIDFHRLGRHRWTAFRWRVKDLAQLLYSTYAVAEIDDRDRLRFWSRYRRALGLGSSKWLLHMIRLKAGRYRRHNQGGQRSEVSSQPENTVEARPACSG